MVWSQLHLWKFVGLNGNLEQHLDLDDDVNFFTIWLFLSSFFVGFGTFLGLGVPLALSWEAWGLLWAPRCSQKGFQEDPGENLDSILGSLGEPGRHILGRFLSIFFEHCFRKVFGSFVWWFLIDFGYVFWTCFEQLLTMLANSETLIWTHYLQCFMHMRFLKVIVTFDIVSWFWEVFLQVDILIDFWLIVVPFWDRFWKGFWMFFDICWHQKMMLILNLIFDVSRDLKGGGEHIVNVEMTLSGLNSRSRTTQPEAKVQVQVEV